MKTSGSNKFCRQKSSFFARTWTKGSGLCGDAQLLHTPPQLKPDEQDYAEPTIASLHALREKTVREEIAARLRPVCTQFPVDEFTRMVEKMAERKLREERRPVW
jgi:hypothetical protein